MGPLYQIAAKYEYLNRLQRETAEENDGLCSDDLEAEIDAVQDELSAKLRNCAIAYKNMQADIRTLHEERMKLSKRESQIKARADWLKNYIEKNTPIGERIDYPEVRLSWRKGNRLVIKKGAEEEMVKYLPCGYYKIEPNRTNLKIALNNGWDGVENYVELQPTNNLIIR